MCPLRVGACFDGVGEVFGDVLRDIPHRPFSILGSAVSPWSSPAPRIARTQARLSARMSALKSRRIVPSSAWRAAEILAAVETTGIAETKELRGAYTVLSGQPQARE